MDQNLFKHELNYRKNKRLTDEDRKLIFAHMNSHNNDDIKHVLAMEELSELSKEISKHLRSDAESTSYTVLEEMADVYITIVALLRSESCNDISKDITIKNIEAAIDAKLVQYMSSHM